VSNSEHLLINDIDIFIGTISIDCVYITIAMKGKDMEQKSTKTLSNEMNHYEQDFQWILENYESLIKSFADNYVAVWDGSVVEHSNNIIELRDKLKHDYSDLMSQICVEYIYKEDPRLILV